MCRHTIVWKTGRRHVVFAKRTQDPCQYKHATTESCFGRVSRVSCLLRQNRQGHIEQANERIVLQHNAYGYISRTKSVLRLNRLMVFVHLEHLLMCFTQVGSPLGVEPYGGGGDGDGGVGLLDNPGGSERVLFVRIVVVRPLVVGMLRHATRYRKQHDVFNTKGCG